MATPGDRKSLHPGATKRKNPASIDIIYDAEIRDIGCCIKCCFFIPTGGFFFDKERSYIYLRENSMETSVAMTHIFSSCVPGFEVVTTRYFDRSPYINEMGCCFTGEPSIEKHTPGCTICWQDCKHPCLSDEMVVISSFQKYCCCIPNKTKKSCCGAYPGNPIMAQNFGYMGVTQPVDTQAFVVAAQALMAQVQAANPK